MGTAAHSPSLPRLGQAVGLLGVKSRAYARTVTAWLGYFGVLALAGALAAWFWFRDDI
jgi:hypothetical protein